MIPFNSYTLNLAADEVREMAVDARGFILRDASADFKISIDDHGANDWAGGVSYEHPVGFTKLAITASSTGLTGKLVIYNGAVQDNNLSVAGGLVVTSMPPITTDGPLQITGPRGKIQGQKYVVGTTPVLIANASDLFEKTRVYAGLLDLYVSGDFSDFGHGDAAFIPAGGSMEFGAGSIVWAVRLAGSAECREVVHYR